MNFRTTPRAARRLQALLCTALLGLAACASDAPSATSPTTSTAAEPSATSATTATDALPATDASSSLDTAVSAPSCDAPTTTTPVDVATVPGVPTDIEVTSFDGTIIRAHWFPVESASAEQPAPTVLAGPGWGSGGDTNTSSAGPLGLLTIARLWEAGYNVLTWDPRGFGESTGTVTIDSPDYEGRDVQQLLDWVATQPEVLLDASRDPRVGMVGGSYGGAIQLVTAGLDCRVDAIVPTIAWHSLSTSLYKAEISKLGWASLLSAVSAGRSLDPNIPASLVDSQTVGTLPPERAEWFADRGAPDLVDDIRIPTLIVQGTIDTLFTLDEAVTNYTILRDNGVPTAMLWFCGGHGTCLSDKGDTGRVAEATLAWLDRYLRNNESVDTGSRFEIVDQRGNAFVADDYPQPTGTVDATGNGTLQLVADGGSGPATPGPNTDVISAFALGVTPARAVNSVDVAIEVTDDALFVGAPSVTLSYSGTVADGDRPTRVFAQLVDEQTGLVLGNQITPIEVILDGSPHEVTVPLEIIAHSASAGDRLTLQLVATTVAYALPRLDGSITFDSISVELPIVTMQPRVA
jgi:ABC-2 type transport system ATP-binding protein